MSQVLTKGEIGSRALTARPDLKTLYREMDRGNDHDVHVIISGLRLSAGLPGSQIQQDWSRLVDARRCLDESSLPQRFAVSE